jgi:hypothetical protein
MWRSLLSGVQNRGETPVLLAGSGQHRFVDDRLFREPGINPLA